MLKSTTLLPNFRTSGPTRLKTTSQSACRKMRWLVGQSTSFLPTRSLMTSTLASKAGSRSTPSALLEELSVLLKDMHQPRCKDIEISILKLIHHNYLNLRSLESRKLKIYIYPKTTKIRTQTIEFGK